VWLVSRNRERDMVSWIFSQYSIVFVNDVVKADSQVPNRTLWTIDAMIYDYPPMLSQLSIGHEDTFDFYWEIHTTIRVVTWRPWFGFGHSVLP
jgi:hypothetical protein